MAFQDSIVQFINEALKGSSLNNKKFQPAAYNGIASVVARPKDGGQLELLPAVSVGNADYKPVEPNDKFNLVIYHKVNSNNYQYQKQDSYGDGFSIKSTTELSMIVWVDGKKAGITPEQAEAFIITGFPFKISEVARKTIGIKSCLITPLAADMDKLRVFRQEYQNVKFFLRPHHIFFQLRYRVELVFDQRCLLTCGCGPA
jgi:hypothetical protein